MSSISSIADSSSAMSVMQYAATQAQSSANNIANASSSSDMAEAIVQQAAAATNVQASLKMIRADHDATQQLIDILA